MQHDPTYKDIFSHAFMVAELLRWFVADLCGGRDLVDALDLSTLRRVPEQAVSGSPPDLRTGSNDMVWRVRFRDAVGDGAWLLVVLMLEFQSVVDFLMPLRVRRYADNQYAEWWRGKRFRSTDRLQPVLGVVLYTGDAPWSAAQRVADLVTPGTTVEGAADLASRTSDLFTGDGYLTLDSRRLREDDFRQDNAASMLAAVEQMAPEKLARRLHALRRQLRGEEHAHLREVVLHWAMRMAERAMRMEKGTMAEVEGLQSLEEHEGYFSSHLEAWKDGYREEGREEGREKERTEWLRSLVTHRFGDAAARRVARRLSNNMEDPAARDELIETIMACENVEELVEQLS